MEKFSSFVLPYSNIIDNPEKIFPRTNALAYFASVSVTNSKKFYEIDGRKGLKPLYEQLHAYVRSKLLFK